MPNAIFGPRPAREDVQPVVHEGASGHARGYVTVPHRDPGSPGMTGVAVAVVDGLPGENNQFAATIVNGRGRLPDRPRRRCTSIRVPRLRYATGDGSVLHEKVRPGTEGIDIDDGRAHLAHRR